jgi:Putative heavy-metal chelation
MHDLVKPAAYLQPRHALQPEAFAPDAVEQWALKKASALPTELFRLSSFWHMDWFIQHLPADRKTRYTARLAQSENYGIACGLTSVLQEAHQAGSLNENDSSLVGADCRDILESKRYANDLDRTAFIDVVMGQMYPDAHDHLTVDQARRDKYAAKSKLFADEASNVLARKGSKAIKGDKPHAHVIGAMSGTHAALLARGFTVTATDMSPDVVGTNLGGVTVSLGSDIENRKHIEAADIVIATGMTFPNGTLPTVMRAARDNNTSTMIWAVTGRNLGHYYTAHGIDCVISDPAPFMQLPGPVRIGISRREK